MPENLYDIFSKDGKIPVWFMRQAGRHMPKFQRLVGSRWITDIVMQPEKAAEIALEPVEVLGVDASIVFMDISTPLELLGIKFSFKPGMGPVFEDDIHKLLDAIDNVDQNKWYLIKEQIGILKRSKAKVIGFGAGPFTLLSYIIKDDSKDKVKTKEFIVRNGFFLLDKLKDLLVLEIKHQMDSGADAFQIFDSWAGSLAGSLMENYVGLLKEAFEAISQQMNRTIYFCRNCNVLLKEIKKTGFSGYLSVDWNCDLSELYNFYGGKIGLQGNLDPFYAYLGGDVMLKEAKKVLDNVPNKRRYIFNLGHGVLPGTDFRNLRQLASFVKSLE